jgi:hypothetical protein
MVRYNTMKRLIREIVIAIILGAAFGTTVGIAFKNIIL